MNDAERRLLAGAAKQHFAFTRAEAIAAGLTRSAIDRRFRSGEYVHIFPRVFRPYAVPVTNKMLLSAAVKWAGQPAVASHRSAGSLYELDGVRVGIPEISTTLGDREINGVILHRTRRLPDSDRWSVDGIPTTRIFRTLLDLGQVLEEQAYEIAAESAFRQRLVSIASLRSYLQDHADERLPGSALLRKFVALRTPSTKPTESAPEIKLIQRLRQAGLGEPDRQFPVVDNGVVVYRIDIAYPQLRLGIEYDSFERHLGRVSFINDRQRNNFIRARGWTLLQATATDLRKPGPFVDAVLSYRARFMASRA